MALSEKEEKLRDCGEMKRILKYEQSHYTKILEHFDSQIAFIDEQIVKHDEEIAVLQEKKATVIQHLAEAPEQLIALARQLRDVENKESKLKTSEVDQAKKVARLKKRITNLRAKLAKEEGKTGS